MYAYLKGIIDQKTENSVILDNNGIGYEIFASTPTLSALGSVGQTVKVFTYLHVREDAMVLYGFSSLKEKQLFLDLLTVSGIGAKIAMTILSGISASDLLGAIATGDTKLLSTVKGIGKKTAERIVLELKGTLENMPLTEWLQETGKLTPAMEAVEALTQMGILKTTAIQMVKAVALPGDFAEQIIQKCLKNM